MDPSLLRTRQSDQLVFYGVLLFLLGLVVGLLLPLMANPRMGLSSHLEGIMNGIFLIVLGLIWTRLVLSNRWLTITFWLAIYGTFANWLAILIAAVFDAGAMLTIAAEGQEGPVIAEGIVNVLLISLSVAMLVIGVTVLIGLNRHMKKNRSIT